MRTDPSATINPRALLKSLFHAAIDSVNPALTLAQFLPEPPRGQTFVLGAGKASAAMAHAVEQAWPTTLQGLVITPYGHAVPCQHIEIVEANHPVPDQAGLDATKNILQLARSAGADDLVLCLISGGGSSLLTLPAQPLTLDHKQQINQQLLRSGANISEINCVRKHLSAIKGGNLTIAANPAKIITLLSSDVPGDNPSVIASGPTVPDLSTRCQALEILTRYSIPIPQQVHDWLQDEKSETPKLGDPRFNRTKTHLIATPQMALNAAAEKANKLGFKTHILSDSIEGEARSVAAMHAAIIRQITRYSQPFTPPCLLLSGGETTVTLRGHGQGGRNTEFLLALALALGDQGIHALAADTDGIDGNGSLAGATISPDTLSRAQSLGLNPQALLNNNDAHQFFVALDDQIITGPTRANVNDFRAFLIESPNYD